MRSRLLYLLRFALVVLLSFLVLKGCFLLLVPAEGALSMGDISTYVQGRRQGASSVSAL